MIGRHCATHGAQRHTVHRPRPTRAHGDAATQGRRHDRVSRVKAISPPKSRTCVDDQARPPARHRIHRHHRAVARKKVGVQKTCRRWTWDPCFAAHCVVAHERSRLGFEIRAAPAAFLLVAWPTSRARTSLIRGCRAVERCPWPVGGSRGSTMERACGFVPPRRARIQGAGLTAMCAGRSRIRRGPAGLGFTQNSKSFQDF